MESGGSPKKEVRGGLPRESGHAASTTGKAHQADSDALSRITRLEGKGAKFESGNVDAGCQDADVRAESANANTGWDAATRQDSNLLPHPVTGHRWAIVRIP